MRKLACLATMAIAGLVAACASDDPTPGSKNTAARSCFLARDVAGWKDGGRGLLNLRTTRDEYYQATLFSPCPEIDFSQRLAIVTRVSERVCEGDDATLLVPRGLGGGSDSCRIDRIRKMSAEDVAALTPVTKP